MNIHAKTFSHVRVLVVGDVMLDQYWFGNVDRVSPEAPVPVLAVKRRESRAGGAANVAHNLLALGAQCHVISCIGDDEAGDEIQRILDHHGASSDLNRDESIDTIVKLRMVAQNQQLLRADFDQRPQDKSLAQCFGNYLVALNNSDVVILSDYGKGNLKEVEKLISAAKQADVPVIIDPKGTNYQKYRGASLITPNMKEFEAANGEVESDADFLQQAASFRESLDLGKLLVTRSDKGMSLFDVDGNHLHSPAKALEVYDVSGAGDTVIAMMALASVSGFNDQQCLELANAVAGIVVGKLGTAVASIDELIEQLS